MGVSPQRRAERAELLRDRDAAPELQPVRRQLGGPIVRNRTFFFGSTTRARATPSAGSYAFQVETPELRDYVLADRAEQRRRTICSGSSRRRRRCLAPTGRDIRTSATSSTPGGVIPAIGRASGDRRRRHPLRSVHGPRRSQPEPGRPLSFALDSASASATTAAPAASPATLGRALRGSRGPFDGTFGNLNIGYTQVVRARR